MARPISQLIPPDLPGLSPQFGSGGAGGGAHGAHPSSMASLKSLLQLPVKQSPEPRGKDSVTGEGKGSEKEKGVDSDEESSSSHSGGRQTHSAFLGPLLWEKTLPCEGGLFQLQYMDLEEFLTENGMGPQTSSMAAQIPSQNSQSAIPNQSGQSQSGQQNQSSQLSSQHPGQLSQLSQLARAPSPTSPVTPGNGQPSVAVETGGSSRAAQTQGMMGGGCIQGAAHPGQATPPDPSSCPQSDPSEVLVKFDPDPADLALSSVPGQEAFDPRRHSFTEEELKPQPMIKKAKKMLVPDEQKDDKYWSRRYKNNEAAKRSRDARRLKENQISVRAAFLEKENAALRQEVADMRKELGRCRNTLHKYEARHGGP